MDAAPLNRDGWVPVEPFLVVEEVEPALDCRNSAAVVDLEGDRAQDPCRIVDVSGRVRMEQRGFRIAVRLVPPSCTPVQDRDQVGLLLLELPLQQVAEEVVISVPPAAMVELNEKQVRLTDRLELAGGALAPEHRVAQRRAHLLEDRCAPEKAEHVRRELRQVLGAEVVGDVALVAGDVCQVERPIELLSALLALQRRQVEPRSPAFRPPQEPGNLGLVGLDPRGSEQELGLATAERELVGAELEQWPGHAESRDRQLRERSAGQRDHRAVREVLDEDADRGQRLDGLENVCVVQDEDERRSPGRELGAEPGHDRVPDRFSWAIECLDYVLSQRIDPVDRSGDVLQQNNGVVVPIVDGDPRERTDVPGSPLGEKRRLAVAGRRHDEHDRKCARSPKPVDEGRPRDGFDASMRNVQL